MVFNEYENRRSGRSMDKTQDDSLVSFIFRTRADLIISVNFQSSVVHANCTSRDSVKPKPSARIRSMVDRGHN